jgi:membrane-associated PAP2 superfamily phosphatase
MIPRWWAREVLLLFTVSLVSLCIFWLTDLDMRVAYFFYGLNPKEPWAVNSVFWQGVYASAQWISIAVVTTGCFLTVLGFIRKDIRIWRRYGIFMVLGIAIGPGLLVNVVFKDHWGRPRPKAMVEFGGGEHYVPPLKFNEAGDGRSFPCGHASAGFSLISLWFIRRDLKSGHEASGFLFQRLLLRLPVHAPLLLALVWGGLLGWVRMEQGGHFLSDVLWSAYITFGVHYVLWPLGTLKNCPFAR